MRTLDGIQFLRFVAALLVVIYHIQVEALKDPGFTSVLEFVRFGGAGVDIFFVISGFIITYTSANKTNFDVKAFAYNRFFRIYPPYWFFLVSAFCSMLFGVDIEFSNPLILFTTVSSVVIALLLSLWVERPYIAWYKNLIGGKLGGSERQRARTT